MICRTWRAAATDLSQLRSWQYDDDSATAAGIKSSATPMQPKTPLPKHWVNPTTHSPFSSFKTPRSLAMLSAPSPIRSLLWPCDRLTDANAVTSNIDENGPSPRTPSPVQPVAPGGSFLDIVLAQMVIGKWVIHFRIHLGTLSNPEVLFSPTVSQFSLRMLVRYHFMFVWEFIVLNYD